MSVKEAIAEELVTQLMGLFESIPPEVLALLMTTAASLVAHFDNLGLNAEGVLPPPVLVSGGENETLAETEHVTRPGAAPMNGVVVAEAVVDVNNMPEGASIAIATEIQKPRSETPLRFEEH